MAAVSPRIPALELRGLRFGPEGRALEALHLAGGRVAGEPAQGARVVELGGRTLLPGLVNAHDHLDQSLFLPPPGAPFEDGYAWAAALEADVARQRGALRVPLVERLFLGGLRNLVCGSTAVAHHDAGMSSAPSMSGDQRRCSTSNSPVPEASLTSVARSPPKQ